jgi:outer membrane translocation and assembly module TamA
MTKSSAVRWAGLLGALFAMLLLAQSSRASDFPNSKIPTPRPKPTAPASADEPAAQPLPRVGALRWEGNDQLATKQLSSVVFTHGPGWQFWKRDPEFSESTLIGDMDRVVALYAVNGFYEAQADYVLEWNEAETRVDVTIRIVEGPDVLLTDFDIELPPGIDIPPEPLRDLTVKLPLVENERFSAERYAASKQLLLDRLAEAAHPRARIEGGATVDLDDHRAQVAWRVIPGPTVFFGDVSIDGLYRVDQRTARREVHVETCERYSTRALQRTRRSMQQQGLYSWVIVQSRPAELEQTPVTEAEVPSPSSLETDAVPPRDPVAVPEVVDSEVRDPASPPVEQATEIWPVEIRVTERSPYTFDVGVGYSSDESFRAQLGWRNVNFFGDARKLRFTALYSGILSKLEAEFTQPYFIDPKLSLTARTELRAEDEPAYEANRLVSSVGLSRPVFAHWRVRTNYQFSLNNVFNVSPDSTLVLTEPTGQSRTATIEFGARRQTTDDLLEPTEGSWLDLVVAPSLREIGSDFDYVGIGAEVRGYRPIFWEGVLAGRFFIGSIEPIRGTQASQIPVVSRFYSGGANSNRGFQYHTMPPAGGGANSDVGGTSLIEASLEWRFRIWNKLGGVVFVDSGVLDLEPWSFPLDDLFWAVGPGIRYDTIVGPLRFDYGFLVNPPPGGSRHQWFISVGHSF